MHIQLLHTSASLTINENWDPDVRDDMEMMLNRWDMNNQALSKKHLGWHGMIFQILVWWWLWRYKVSWSQALVFSPSSCPYRLSFVQQHQIWEAFSASLLFWWAEIESSAECARCEASPDLSSARCGCAGCSPAEQLCIVLRRRRLLPSLSLLRQQLRKLYSPHHFHENLHFPQARARADSIQALLWRPWRHARPRQGDHQTALLNEKKPSLVTGLSSWV